MEIKKEKSISWTYICMKLLVLAFFCVSFIVSAVPTMAAEKTAVAPGMACKSGRYIYYCYSTYSKSGILRYDTQTMKKKRITSGKETNGFCDLSLKGKYIYAAWDHAYERADSSKYYIYRINIKTGKKKKLARGGSPVVAGNYIYFEKVKSEDGADAGTGTICRMTLSGKNKKTVKTGIVDADGRSDISKLYVCNGEVLYARDSNEDVLYTLKGEEVSRSSLKIEEDVWCNWDNHASDSVTCDGYQYYISKSVKNLCRKKISSGKVTKLATYEEIDRFRICGKYILFEAYVGEYKNGLGKCRAYCMKLNGKGKKKLATWGES